jgi:uncharacterized SAM-dependent methyltransferase
MRLRSRTGQCVRIPVLDLQVFFAAGEEVRTEVSPSSGGRELPPSWPPPGCR